MKTMDILCRLTTSCGFLSFKKYLSNCSSNKQVPLLLLLLLLLFITGNQWNETKKHSKCKQKLT